jgi:hypothetical protein
VLAREVVLADEGDKGSLILAHPSGLDGCEEHDESYVRVAFEEHHHLLFLQHDSDGSLSGKG